MLTSSTAVRRSNRIAISDAANGVPSCKKDDVIDGVLEDDYGDLLEQVEGKGEDIDDDTLFLPT